MMVCGAVFITIFYVFIKSKLSNKEKNQANEVSKAALKKKEAI